MKQRIVTTLLLASTIFAAIISQVLVKTNAQEKQENDSSKSIAGDGKFIPGEIIVRFRNNTIASKTREVLNFALRAPEMDIPVEVSSFEGSEIVSGLRLARVEPANTLLAVAALNLREDVMYAEPNYIRRKDALPNDSRFGEQWGLKNIGQVGFNDATGQQQSGTPGADIDAELAWNFTTGSHSIVVGVIDEGIDINHPDLRDNIWRNPGEVAGNNVDDDGNGFIDDISGWDFYHNDASVYDGIAGDNSTDSHGTHVAGTIGATGNNGLGVTGANWQVSIMSLKILPKDCTPIPSCDAPAPSSVLRTIAAFNYARMMRERGINLRVLNNSYGGGGKSQAELDAIRALNDAGILFVASAGNDSLDSGSFPHFPSNYDAPNVISVAATDRFDNIAAFSTYGSRVVSIGAPGRSILSTTPNSAYSIFSGTSMAAPHVAGTAALVVAANPTISTRNLRGVLAYSGDVLPALQGKTTTGRRLNAYNSLLTAAENDETHPANISDLRIIGQDGRTVTLTWTAVGDDGNSGQAADYDFVFTNTTTGIVTVTPASLATLLPNAAGSQETASVRLPYRNFAGTIELRIYDNAGNVSRTSVAATVNVNNESDPYEFSFSTGTTLSSGGTPLNLRGDDTYRKDYALPFNFPFFGQNRTNVSISTNGSIYFTNSVLENDAASSVEGLNGPPMIAGLWDDLRTDRRAGDDVYVTADENRVIFRWQAVTFNTPLANGTLRGENPVNFEIELRRDGTIQIRYGDGNTRLFPIVGISGGEPDAYVIESHTSEQLLKNLTTAPTVTFTPRTSSPRPTPFDFDGDGKSDVSVFRPSNGTWYLQQSSNGFTGLQFGAPMDRIVPADYDGDSKTDVAVFRSGVWYLNRSQLGFTGVSFGEANDIPMPADYDGDGKADIAVFRPSTGTWYLLRSQLGFTGIQFGQQGDKPIAADYDGDGKSDIAVFRSGIWYINRSSLGFTGVSFGEVNDTPVPADYDGDSKADIAVFRPSNGVWYLQRSQLGFTGIQFGTGGDFPVPADYDGDGKADVSVFRNGTWFLNRTQSGFTGISFGAGADRPVPNALVPQ